MDRPNASSDDPPIISTELPKRSRPYCMLLEKAKEAEIVRLRWGVWCDGSCTSTVG